ncbi:MAG: Brp/Blh family beta-carotene 15,15'-dioxygenase [Candidatus Thermoplasmatota archaeon]|nr:Brp/Blh family beta-carotene 15,15'-dioxygenase [Candidatus Thermoplasmatota archaeon]
MELIGALIDLGAWNLIGLAGIVLIGLPHGALDGAVAMHLGIVQRFSDLARFMVVYIALAALVVVTWTVAPSISLILFLTISMLHFGAGDVKNGKGSLGFTEALAHGGLAIVGISQFHRSEVNEIFAYLTNQDTAAVWLAVDILTVGVIVAIITCVFQASKNPKWATTILELLLLGIVYALAPPLLGFAIYFCCVHSARHFRKIYATIKENVASGNIKNQAILFTVISWIAAGIAFWMFADFADPGPTILRITFIGLAALTVPHMILIDGITRFKNQPVRNTN